MHLYKLCVKIAAWCFVTVLKGEFLENAFDSDGAGNSSYSVFVVDNLCCPSAGGAPGEC